MAPLLATLDDFEDAITESKTGDKNAIAHKNALQASLQGMLRDNGNYVNSVCGGDVENMVSSGYLLSKERQPAKVQTPVIEKVEQGENPGDMFLKVKRQKGQKSLEYHFSKDPLNGSTLWTILTSSRCKLVIPNLEQGVKYWFRVVAIGSNNQRLFSEPVSQYVMQYGVANAA